MKTGEFEAIKVNFKKYSKKIGEFRYEIWKNEKSYNPKYFPKSSWIDDYDKDAIHWIIFDNDKIVASARLGIYHSPEKIPYSNLMKSYLPVIKYPAASLNRLIVRKEYRNRNIARLLDAVRIEEAKFMKVKTLIGQPVFSRIKALEYFGFKYISKIDSIKELPTIKLNLMLMYLNNDEV